MLFGKQKVLRPVPEFCFCTGASKKSEIFTKYLYMNFPHCPNFFRIFGVTKVWLLKRLLQTVLFLIDSVFDALLACFDESMDCIGGYKSW